MTTRCTCGRPTPESAYLCSECTDDLARLLGDTPALVDELDVTLSRQRRFETQTSSSRSSEQSLPYDVAASNALHALRAELVSLVLLCEEERLSSVDYRDRDPGETCASMSRWLSWRVDSIAGQRWAVDALQQLRRVHERAELAIDRPPERTFAGPCDACGRDLYAGKGRSVVKCAACGLTYDLAARREWLLRAVNDQLATTTEIARALTSLEMPVTNERIRQWRHRERIEQRGVDRRGHPLYRVGDVVALLLEHAEKSSA